MARYNQHPGKYNYIPGVYNGPLGITYTQLEYTYAQDHTTYTGEGGYREPTLTSRVCIVQRTHPTLQARVRIFPVLAAQVQISQQHGWPIPDMDDENWDSFVATQLTSRVHINAVNLSTQTLIAYVRIQPIRYVSLQAGVHIARAAFLQAQVRIAPRSHSNEVIGSFSIQGTTQHGVRVVFYTPGNQFKQSLMAKTCIRGTMQTRTTGHFIVSYPRALGKVIAFDFDSNLRHLQTVGAKVRLVHL